MSHHIGGQAGYEAALVASELGADVTVIADEGLGGNCVLWDCVPSKALIVAAEAMGWVHTAADMGVRLAGVESIDRTIVDFPKVSSEVLTLGANQSRDIERRVATSGVEVVRGRGRISGSHEVTATLEGGEERTFPADYVLIATGSGARILPFFEPDGERVLPIEGFHRLPGAAPEHDTVLSHGELVTAVELPPPVPGAPSAYRKVRERASYAFALVSVAALVRVRDDRFADARIVFGGLAHAPWRAHRAEEVLHGRPVTEESFRVAADTELAEARTGRDNAYKVPLAVNTLVSVLRGLTGEAAR